MAERRRIGSRGPREIAARLALAVGATALVLGAFEAVLRMAGYGAIFDVYSKPSIFWRHDPVLGWSHEPGAASTYVGPRPFPIEFRTPVQINSLGLRGPELAEAPADGVRMLFLGDSLVVGFEVRFEETFGELVQRRLSAAHGFPVQVVNAGVRGYGTDQVLLYYREAGRALRPDMVVYFQSRNDPENNVTLHRMRRPFGKAAFGIDEDGGLSLRGHPIPRYPLCSAWVLDERYRPTRADTRSARAFCWIQTNLSDHSALFSWLAVRIARKPGLVRLLYRLGSGREQTAQRLPGGSPLDAVREVALGALPWLPARAAAAAGDAPARLEAPFRLTSALVAALAREVRADGAEFVLVVDSQHYARMDAALLASADVSPTFIELAASRDLHERMHFRHDQHLTATGHYVMGRALAPRLSPYVRAAFEKRGAPSPGAAE